MPDNTVTGVLRTVRRRWRLRTLLHAVAAGGAVFAGTLILLTLPDVVPAGYAIPIAAAAGAVMAAWLGWEARSLSLTDCARLVEAAAPFDNLVVTAAELDERPRPVRAELRDAIAGLAAARLRDTNAAATMPIVQPIVVAAAIVIGCGLLVSDAGRRSLSTVTGGRGDDATARTDGGDMTVRITPPPYTKRPVEVLENPVQVTAIAGSRIQITSGTRVLREWRATETAGLELRVGDQAPARFLSVIVVPDAAPAVRIHTPGRDTAFAQPSGAVAIGVEGRDDLGLSSLTLRYMRASGGGENLTFTEGELPLAIDRAGDRQWTGQARLALADLGLADGDVLVYRAIARDANPAGEPVQSDAFLIEIGRAAEIASAGFALPTEDRKYAISQQMVIYKTEQLIATTGKSPPGRSLGEGWLDQTRGIAVEQRMVRAEVVFLSGGEVEDEVEEAAGSHELAEGRLENPGRAELVRALSFMSRAEAQLNDGRAEAALVFERQALASLERALDRRRYFLRTLPDRSRIDAGRRLSGERREARSWSRPRPETSSPASLEQRRVVVRALMTAIAAGEGGAGLAARVAAIDPGAAELQTAAVAIATAASAGERRAAAGAAIQAITAHALADMPASSVPGLETDPLAGRLSDALARPPR